MVEFYANRSGASLLSARGAMRLLLEKGLLPPSAILDEDVEVVDISRRNHNYKVRWGGSSGYVLKQATDEDRAATLAREVQVCQVFEGLSAKDPLRNYVPRIAAVDEPRAVLVIEGVGDGVTLTQHHARTGRFSGMRAARLAKALAALHHGGGDRGEEWNRHVDRFHGREPWVLSLHRPQVDILRQVSQASTHLIRMIQTEPAVGRALDDLRSNWDPAALVHFDVKWDNCLITDPVRNGGVVLIDWELVRGGDPLWDLGSAIGAFLSFWVHSIPNTGRSQPIRRALEAARFPLDRMTRAIGSLWNAYSRQTNTGGDEVLARTVRYAAARLLQTEYEFLQRRPQLTGSTVLAVQLAHNLLVAPLVAAAELLRLNSCSEA